MWTDITLEHFDTYIYRYMKPPIANGHLYLAQPPLYKVYKETKGKTVMKYAFIVMTS